MSFTQSDLDNINAAIKLGALSVRKGDRMITYRSSAELLAAKREISAELANTAGDPPSGGRHRVAKFHDV